MFTRINNVMDRALMVLLLVIMSFMDLPDVVRERFGIIGGLFVLLPPMVGVMAIGMRINKAICNWLESKFSKTGTKKD